MFKLKFILPMFAFVLAIGMSFAFTNATGDGYYDSGYVIIGNDQYPVDFVCNLQSDENCTVKIEGLEGEFIVYDALTGDPLKSNSPTTTIPDPRP